MSSSANDELEFVKMRYRTPIHVSSSADDERENMAFYNLNLTTEFPDSESPSRSRRERHHTREREQPPSYDTTMRNIDGGGNNNSSNFYAGDRQSVRSKASTRSKRSTHRTTGATGGGVGAGSAGDSVTYSEARNLPWVQITPSTSNDSHMLRHYP